MRKVFLISILSLLAVSLLAALHSRNHVSETAKTPQNNQGNTPKTSQDQKNKNDIQSHDRNPDEFEKKFINESQRISQLDSDPDKTQRELEVFSNSLNTKELQVLKNKVLNQSEDGDTRSLAAYLIGLSQHETAIDLLKEIALQPLPETKNDRLLTFEEVLRASTVDGLVRHPQHEKSLAALKEISEKTNSSLLGDRSRRGYESRKNHFTSPEEQETKALRKLVGDINE